MITRFRHAAPAALPLSLLLAACIHAPAAIAASPPAGTPADRIAIERRGGLIPSELRKRTEERIESTFRPLEAASHGGDRDIADRLAVEFGTPPAALIEERADLGETWSDLVMAHTFAASPATGPTPREIFKLHDDGMGWSEIAYGIGLDLKHMLAALRVECRVALGMVAPDGRVQLIREDASLPGDGETGPREGAAGSEGGGS